LREAYLSSMGSAYCEIVNAAGACDREIIAVPLQTPRLDIRVQRDGPKRVAALGKLEECEAAGV
jgi:hypothetical protein